MGRLKEAAPASDTLLRRASERGLNLGSVTAQLLALRDIVVRVHDLSTYDLLYEVVWRRYDKGRSIVVTTNKAFPEWNQVFESATCLVTLIDRLCHRAEIVEIRGFYRVKESKARTQQRRTRRAAWRGGIHSGEGWRWDADAGDRISRSQSRGSSASSTA